jgi:hypothetical protein
MFLADAKTMLYRLVATFYKNNAFWLDWFSVLVRPFYIFYEEFEPYREANLRRVKTPPLSLSLAHYLTEQLGELVTIECLQPEQPLLLQRLYFAPTRPTLKRLSEVGNENPLQTYPLGRLSEISDSPIYFFNVHVAVGFTNDNRLHALIAPYLLAGLNQTSYQIVKDL